MRRVHSAFIFRLPCGQQREQPHRATPTDLLGPCEALDALVVPKHPGIKPLSDSIADASLRSARDLNPQPTVLANCCSTLELAPTRRARPVVSQTFDSRYATRLLCFPCRVTRNSKTSGPPPGLYLSLQPHAVPSPRVPPASPCLQSSDRWIALVPPLSLFGMSA